MKERFLVLDFFRGVFASFVVFFHMSVFTKSFVLNNSFILNADVFVDFFFVLSGFVIAYTYQYISKGRQFARFYKKRFLRLYPLHVVMLFAFLIVELSKNFLANYVHVNELNNPDNNAISFVSSLLLINSVKMPGVHDVSWNIPSWSISAEMIAYLIFGVLMICIHQLGLFKIRIACYLAVLLLCGAWFYTLTGDFKLTYNYDYGFLRGILGFFCGAICFNVYSLTRQIFAKFDKGYFDALELLILLLVFYLVWHRHQIKKAEYLYLIAFFLAIFVFAFEKGIISKSIKKAAFGQAMGRYSYSIYMIHALLISLFNIVFIRILKFPPSAYSYFFIVNYMLVYFVSQYTYKHIEMRFNTKKLKPALEAAQ